MNEKAKTAGTDCGVCAECDGSGTCVYDETQDSDCAATSCPDACDLSPDDNPFTFDYADDVANDCVDIFICSDNPVTLDWIEPIDLGHPPGFGMPNSLVIFPISANIAILGCFENFYFISLSYIHNI